MLLMALQDSNSLASDLSAIGQGVLDYLTPFYIPFVIVSLVVTLLAVSAQFGPWRTLAPFGLSLWAVIVASGGTIIALSVLTSFIALGILLSREAEGFSDFLLFILSCGVTTAILGAVSGVLQWLVFLPDLGHISALRWIVRNALFWSISYPLSLLLAAVLSQFFHADLLALMMVVFGVLSGCLLGVKIGALAAEHRLPESKGAAEWLMLAVAGRWLFALYLALLLLVVVAPMYNSVAAGIENQNRVHAEAARQSQAATAESLSADATRTVEAQERATQVAMTAVALPTALSEAPAKASGASVVGVPPLAENEVMRLRQEGFAFCGSRVKLSKLNTYVCVKHEPHDGTSWDLTPVVIGGEQPFEVGLAEDYSVRVGMLRAESNAYTNFNFKGLASQGLTVGTYEYALGEPVDGVPFLGVRLDGRGLPCAHSVGRFDILGIEYYQSTIDIKSLAVDFVQYCTDGSSSVFGIIRYNSTVPL